MITYFWKRLLVELDMVYIAMAYRIILPIEIDLILKTFQPVFFFFFFLIVGNISYFETIVDSQEVGKKMNREVYAPFTQLSAK